MRVDELTAIAGKGGIYGADPWFRCGLASVATRVGRDQLWRLATLIAKPECVYTRQLRVVLDYLAEHRFGVVASRPIRFDACSVREMWKYHWRAATQDRRSLAADLLSMGESMFLVVVDQTDPGRVPASVRLSALKGSTLAEQRLPGQLRTVLEAQGRMLNFVHTADDPADVVRELGLLFGEGEHEALFEELADPASHSPTKLVQTLYWDHPERSVDKALAYRAMRESLESVSGSRDGQASAAAAALRILDVDRLRPGALPWRGLRANLVKARPDLSLWNPVLHAAERIRQDQPGVRSDMPDGTEADWVRR